MRLSRRFATLSAAVALILASFGLADSADAGPRPNPQEIQLQVLSFNDFQGQLEPPSGRDETLGTQLDPSGTPVGGAEYLASTLERLRQKAHYSQTVAAGDLIGGSPFLSGLFHDEPAVEALNAMNLDVSSVGNHDLDEGVTELLRMQRGGCHPEAGCYAPWGEDGYPGANFPWLAANMVRTSTGTTVLPGTTIRTVGGIKVGYIGVSLEATRTLVAQAGIRGIEFRDELATANRAAGELRRRGVHTIIVLLHEGGLQSGTYQQCIGMSGPVLDIAKKLSPEIDLVVTGHTHQPYVCTIPDPAGRPRMVTSASSFGRVVTETTLTISTRTGDVERNRTTATNHLVTRTDPDPAQSEIISRWSAAAAPVANRVIGSVSADIGGSQSRGNEAPLADLIADAQLAATAAPADGAAQIAFADPGGGRSDLTVNQISGGEQPGEVTYGEAFTAQPFGNLLVTMDLTGAQIEQLLEQQARVDAHGNETALIFGVSRGFTFNYEPAAPIGKRIDPASIRLNGITLNPATRYRIVTNSFLADGGDQFTVFKNGTNRIGGGEELQAFTDYLTDSSPVAPPEDRIAGI